MFDIQVVERINKMVPGLVMGIPIEQALDLIEAELFRLNREIEILRGKLASEN